MSLRSLSVAVGIIASATGMAMADGTGILTTGAYSSGSGGEFTATTISGFIGLSGLPADLDSETFQTFCLEVNETFSPGSTYNMVINTVAFAGGSGGPFLALDERAAYLYHNFRNMTLTGYDYTAGGRQASAGDLQAALWYIQGNQSGGANNAFVALADAAVSSGEWSGLGDVRVLNLYDADGGFHQDVLTIIPAPGATALLGLAGLMAGRRRRASNA